MELLIVGGWLFWLGVTIVAGLIIWGIEAETGWGTLFNALLGGFTLWYFTGAVNPLPWLKGHWADLLIGVFAYILIGAIWGLVKWWFFLHNKADSYEQQRTARQAEYERNKNDTGIAGMSYKDWLSRGYDFPPSPATHKADITMWMVWWPFSGVWTLINDPLKRIYRMIYQGLVTTYARMANAVFAGRFTELK